MIEKISLAMTIVGALAFGVSVITEVTKNFSFMKKIPTDLQVLVLSVVLTMTAMLAYASYYAVALAWYYFVGALFGAFVVAFVAMYGWAKLTDLWGRYGNGPK